MRYPRCLKRAKGAADAYSASDIKWRWRGEYIGTNAKIGASKCEDMSVFGGILKIVRKTGKNSVSVRIYIGDNAENG